MTGNEKNLIYNLLKTASSSLYGYDSPDFKDIKDFSEKKIQTQSSENLPSENKEQNIISQTPAEGNFIENYSKNSGYTNQEANIIERNSDSSLTIEKLVEKIINCKRCSVYDKKSGLEKGKGVFNPYVLVIKDNNNTTDLIQTSEEEKLLIKMLNSIFLDPDANCYITNTIKCKVSEKNLISKANTESCRSFIDAEIHILKPKFILVMGEESLKSLLNLSEDADFSAYRQKILEYNKTPLIATYSPLHLLRNPKFKGMAWEDLKFLRSELDKKNPEFKYNFIPKA